MLYITDLIRAIPLISENADFQSVKSFVYCQGRIQADAWKPGLQCDFFKYGISPGLSEKKL